MEFYRSPQRVNGVGYENIDEDGENEENTGEPINYATAWLDMDHVYGNMLPSSPDYLKYRQEVSGKMLIDETTNLPPLDENTGLYRLYEDAM